MTPEENFRNWRNYEVSHAINPDLPELFGVVDELQVAIVSGNKELQGKIERGEVVRYNPTEFNDGRKHSKKRDVEIKRSWQNAENANKKWKDYLKNQENK